MSEGGNQSIYVREQRGDILVFEGDRSLKLMKGAGSRILSRRCVSRRVLRLKAPKYLGLHQQDRIQFFIGCGHVAGTSVGCVRTPTVTAGGMALYRSRIGRQPTATTSRGSTK